VFELKRKNREGQPLWGYRYRLAGRGSRRVQQGGFAFEQMRQQHLSASSSVFGVSAESRAR
jgi:hypothetical protein